MTEAWTVLAAAQQQVPEDVGKAGPLGLLMMVLLLIVVLFLGRSMGRHIKKVPVSFDPADQPVSVPDSPAELIDGPQPRQVPQPGQELLDTLRRAPLAIEPPRPGDDGRPQPRG
ncbi:hypothetical protein O2W14_15550 [Modestobacter sp. VKM Ac-2986]|uniref:hypothetical protein n=1 Tax=Modestobacter sp. VKM Ac-2986 TaxID=3004140 RepID=UPI0022ABC3AF|nr:hypothetical protein [Modestobacter sp. VKM Ac-2986]MCZ2830251.1 hypothetical protein [Modestobacter sp. VKM Ac-2986]